jgi:hypothetical protein
MGEPVTLAAKRTALHAGQKSQRQLSTDYEVVGLAGEEAFAAFSGLEVDTEDRPEGDDGADFTVPLRIDVKTARKAFNLIVEEGKVRADVYVLAEYDDEHGTRLIGWEWGQEVSQAPCKDFGFAIVSHYIPATSLRPMDSLLRLLRRLDG